MTYQITAINRGEVESVYDGIEAANAIEAIDRIISNMYESSAIEFNGELVVIGYEFQAKRLEMVLS